MWKKINSLQESKRRNYLFILPGVFIATVAILFMQISKTNYDVKFYTHIVFMLAFVIGWLLAYRNHRLKYFEYFMLILVYIYYLLTIALDIIGSINAPSDQELGTFVIWLPLIVIYTFTVLPKHQAILSSIILLILTMAPGLYYYIAVSPEASEALTSTYLSTAVYSVILLFAYQLIRTDVEVQVMRRQLYLDPLTKVGNRSQIDEWMSKLIKKADEEPFSILFLDIDFFKSINDQLGHKVGDDVLKELAQVLQNHVEKPQLIGRWGGEEFIILVKVKECEAYQIAEELCVAVAEHDFKEVDWPITISIGVTEFVEGDTVDTILIRADERLYNSKNEGRNRVTGGLLMMEEVGEKAAFTSPSKLERREKID